MSPHDELNTRYSLVCASCLPIKDALVEQLTEALAGRFSAVDRVYGRVKSRASFLRKVAKDPGKYDPPFAQVEDFIALRVLAVCAESSDRVAEFIKTGFCGNVEDYYKAPPDPNQFGYEGHQIVQSIPTSLMPESVKADFPKVFEIQVKTLFMHAWAEAEHALRYEKRRADVVVPAEVQRRLAWVAASAWGCDTIVSELYLSEDVP